MGDEVQIDLGDGVFTERESLVSHHRQVHQ